MGKVKGSPTSKTCISRKPKKEIHSKVKLKKNGNSVHAQQCKSNSYTRSRKSKVTSECGHDKDNPQKDMRTLRSARTSCESATLTKMRKLRRTRKTIKTALRKEVRDLKAMMDIDSMRLLSTKARTRLKVRLGDDNDDQRGKRNNKGPASRVALCSELREQRELGEQRTTRQKNGISSEEKVHQRAVDNRNKRTAHWTLKSLKPNTQTNGALCRALRSMRQEGKTNGALCRALRSMRQEGKTNRALCRALSSVGQEGKTNGALCRALRSMRQEGKTNGALCRALRSMRQEGKTNRALCRALSSVGQEGKTNGALCRALRSMRQEGKTNGAPCRALRSMRQEGKTNRALCRALMSVGQEGKTNGALCRALRSMRQEGKTNGAPCRALRSMRQEGKTNRALCRALSSVGQEGKTNGALCRALRSMRQEGKTNGALCRALRSMRQEGKTNRAPCRALFSVGQEGKTNGALCRALRSMRQEGKTNGAPCRALRSMRQEGKTNRALCRALSSVGQEGKTNGAPCRALRSMRQEGKTNGAPGRALSSVGQEGKTNGALCRALRSVGQEGKSNGAPCRALRSMRQEGKTNGALCRALRSVGQEGKTNGALRRALRSVGQEGKTRKHTGSEDVRNPENRCKNNKRKLRWTLRSLNVGNKGQQCQRYPEFHSHQHTGQRQKGQRTVNHPTTVFEKKGIWGLKLRNLRTVNKNKDSWIAKVRSLTTSKEGRGTRTRTVKVPQNGKTNGGTSVSEVREQNTNGTNKAARQHCNGVLNTAEQPALSSPGNFPRQKNGRHGENERSHSPGNTIQVQSLGSHGSPNDESDGEDWHVERGSTQKRRRSDRWEEAKLNEQFQIWREGDIEKKVREGCEEGLKLVLTGVKGRGVVTVQEFRQGEFVVAFEGDLIQNSQAIKRERKYQDCFMYYFIYRGRRLCMDGTRVKRKLGHLLNHSRQGNCKPTVVTVDHRPHIVFLAARNIQAGEELTIDYGDRTSLALKQHPWLRH